MGHAIMKTAIVIGATGVTGKHITRELLKNNNYQKVVVFTRRLLEVKHPKLINHQVDFDKIEDWASFVQGGDLFCAMGTTRKQAGGKDAQYKVDYTYQANVIEAAAKNGVKRLFLVSSSSASIESKFFYPNMKGQLEEFSRKQNFETLVFFKPSIIEAQRPNIRIAEKIGAAVLRALSGWFSGMKNYKPIPASQLGSAIVSCASGSLDPGEHTYKLGKIFDFL